jgi:periplasmic divalent cation tolerance protein
MRTLSRPPRRKDAEHKPNFVFLGALAVQNKSASAKVQIVNEFVQVTTTTSTRQDAEEIAAELVSRKLAGCVQVSGPIRSTFRWQGEIETAEEWMCTAKTSRAQIPAIQNLLKEIHRYEVPELIATPIVEGGEAYLKWLGEQLSG